MHPQFTYEEVRRLDAFRAQHPGPPSAPPRPRRHLARRLRRAARAWLRDRARDDVVVDLRPLHTCLERPMVTQDRPADLQRTVTPASH